MQWVRIRSWHAARPGASRTRCGLLVTTTDATSPTLPMNERSCENCLRLLQHDER